MDGPTSPLCIAVRPGEARRRTRGPQPGRPRRSCRPASSPHPCGSSGRWFRTWCRGPTRRRTRAGILVPALVRSSASVTQTGAANRSPPLSSSAPPRRGLRPGREIVGVVGGGVGQVAGGSARVAGSSFDPRGWASRSPGDPRDRAPGRRSPGCGRPPHRVRPPRVARQSCASAIAMRSGASIKAVGVGPVPAPASAQRRENQHQFSAVVGAGDGPAPIAPIAT